VDGVCPPGHGDLAPFGQQGRVVARLLGEVTHLVSESQGLLEIAKRENPFKLRDTVALDQAPFRDLALECLDLLFADLRRITTTRFALLSGELVHGFLIVQLRNQAATNAPHAGEYQRSDRLPVLQSRSGVAP